MWKTERNSKTNGPKIGSSTFQDAVNARVCMLATTILRYTHRLFALFISRTLRHIVFQRHTNSRERKIPNMNMKSTIPMYQLSLWSHRWCFYKCEIRAVLIPLSIPFNSIFWSLQKKREKKIESKQTQRKIQIPVWVLRKKFRFSSLPTERKEEKYSITRKRRRRKKNTQINLIRKINLNRRTEFSCSRFCLCAFRCVWAS